MARGGRPLENHHVPSRRIIPNVPELQVSVSHQNLDSRLVPTIARYDQELQCGPLEARGVGSHGFNRQTVQVGVGRVVAPIE